MFSDDAATVAIIVPSKFDLQLAFVEHKSSIMMYFGFTRKSKKDPFVKKLGRENAEKNIKIEETFLYGIDVHEDKHIYKFALDVDHNHKSYMIKFTLTTVGGSDKVKMVGAFCKDLE